MNANQLSSIDTDVHLEFIKGLVDVGASTKMLKQASQSSAALDAIVLMLKAHLDLDGVMLRTAGSFSQRIVNALERLAHPVLTLRQLELLSAKELEKSGYMGAKTVKELSQALRVYGLNLRSENTSLLERVVQLYGSEHIMSAPGWVAVHIGEYEPMWHQCRKVPGPYATLPTIEDLLNHLNDPKAKEYSHQVKRGVELIRAAL